MAAELVRYTNIEKKYGVTYWSIGNEPSIYTQLGQAYYDYTTEHLNRNWRAIALAMKELGYKMAQQSDLRFTSSLFIRSLAGNRSTLLRA